MRMLQKFTWLALACRVALSQDTPSNLQKHTIAAPGINASYIGYGATLTNLVVADKDGTPRDVVLGYDEGSQYVNDTEHEHTYFGAVGKYFFFVAAVSLAS